MYSYTTTDENLTSEKFSSNYSQGEAGSCATIYPNDFHNKLSNLIYIAGSLCCVVVGLAGNILSVAVFSSAAMRPISSNVYLLALAVSDAIYLISVLLSKLLPTLVCWDVIDSRFDIVNSFSFACVALQYFDDLFADFSTCLILSFTTERFLAVYKPTRLKQICTVKRARIVCLSLLLVVALSIGPHHVFYIHLNRNPDVCTISEDDEAIFTALYAAESVLYRIIPVVLIALLNIYIIVRVHRVAVNRSRLKNQGQAQPLTSPRLITINIEINVCCSNRGPLSRDASHNSLQLTITLILVSTTYVLLHIPVLIHFVLMKLYRSDLISLEKRALLISLNYCRFLYVTGFAVNFFLYTVSGSLFREQLGRIFSRWSRSVTGSHHPRNEGLEGQDGARYDSAPICLDPSPQNLNTPQVPRLSASY